jgi:hypothetical protein
LRFAQSSALDARSAMSSRFLCAADITVRCIAVATKPHGGIRLVSIRPPRLAPCG